MSTVIDPVQSPQAYQNMLIGLVGDDDPAQVQEATSAALREGGFHIDHMRRTLDALRRSPPSIE